MTDDSGKIGDKKKIGGVSSTADTSKVKGAEEVGSVGEVKKTGAIGGVKSAGSVRTRQATRTMTAEERAHLFQMIEEEAEKLFGDSEMSKEKKEILEDAVKMAVDSGILIEGDEE